jgi:hypothetical protein
LKKKKRKEGMKNSKIGGEREREKERKREREKKLES